MGDERVPLGQGAERLAQPSAYLQPVFRRNFEEIDGRRHPAFEREQVFPAKTQARAIKTRRIHAQSPA